MDSLIGQHIGRYKIIKYLEQGGMGTVYEAYDPDFDRHVALKLLPAKTSSDDTARARFNREVKMIARLEHTAIVPVYDTGEYDNQLYLVMRLMKGGSLADLLLKRPPSIRETTNIIKRLASALDFAHKEGVVHRDLKPGNILFDEDGKAYLSDFGIAKIVGSTSTLTGIGIVGTWAYMSPEQFQGKMTVDHRADIYAYGIILFEMLTGRMPYQADTPGEWVNLHINEPVPFIHEIRDDLPIGCEAIVEKAMAKLPEERFESAGQMAHALETLTKSNINEQERKAFVAGIKLSDTVDTAAGTGFRKRPFSSRPLQKWIPWVIITALAIGLLTVLLLNTPGLSPFQATPTLTSTSTAAPTFTATPANTPPPIIEGFIVFIFYDPASAILQTEEGSIARIPENGQLPIPTIGKPVFLQSNAGSMELLLPDKTRLFIDRNTSIKIERVRTDNNPKQTEIVLDEGLIIVSNDTDSVSIVGPFDIQVDMNIGMMEIVENGRQVNVDCIDGSCPVSVAGESNLILQKGESTFVSDSGEVAEIGGARYSLYNNIINRLLITPTPTHTPTPSPTVAITLEPTRSWPETIEFGRSVNAKPLEAVRFGDGPTTFIFVGGLHAGLAPGTVVLAQELIRYFEDNLDEIPESVTLYIIPSANPDSPLAVGKKEGRFNANGVDLNRNWGCRHVEDPIIGGNFEPGRGGSEPFSEPESVALRDFIIDKAPAGIVFWMARANNGLISPGVCEERNLASDGLGAIYSAAASYEYISDIEGTIGFELNGDASNWLDLQGYATISVILRDYVEIDFQRNLAGIRAVMNQYRNSSAIPFSLQEGAPDEIVFQSNRDGDYEIFIMNVDGSNQRQLTFNEQDDRFPRVSPDGRMIVFESERNGNQDIVVMDRYGSNQRELTSDPAKDRLPAWSPDGQQIIFHSARDDRESELYIMDSNGLDLHQITLTDGVEGHSSWSINNQLAYNVREPGQSYWQMYTSDVDGDNVQKITGTQVDEWSPEWSPDGEHILFLSERDSTVNAGIYIMNADGGDIQLLYNDPLEEWGPVWSANGSQIVFTVDQPNDTAEIFIMNANGTDVSRVTQRGGYPSWAVAIEPEEPTQTAVTESITATPTSTCVENALNRWQDNLYPEFADRLGCVKSSELRLPAVYQLYEHGLIVWREDTDSLYALYYSESYEIHPVISEESDFYLNEQTKGGIGYLWANQSHIQSLLGEPLAVEMGASEFTLQEFENGTIFYFQENRGNSYVLLADQNELRIVQEK